MGKFRMPTITQPPQVIGQPDSDPNKIWKQSCKVAFGQPICTWTFEDRQAVLAREARQREREREDREREDRKRMGLSF